MKIKYLTFLAVAVVGLVAGGTTPAIAAVVVTNNSFEAVTLPVQNHYTVPSDIASVAGWTFAPMNVQEFRYTGLATKYWTDPSGPGANVGGLGSFSPYPDGNNVAFLMGGGSFSQTLLGFEVGQSYAVSFYSSSRSGMEQAVRVKMGNETLLFGADNSILPPSNAWTLYTSNTFSAAANELTLSFEGVYISDRTAFIDVVNVVQIPEPATMSLLGLSGLMLVLRKRKSSKV